MAVKLTDDLKSCPAKLIMNAYVGSGSKEKFEFDTNIDLSKFESPNKISNLRFRGIINAVEHDTPGDTIDTQRHGIYLDDAKIIKAGDFKMSLDESISPEDGKVKINFNHGIQAFPEAGRQISAADFAMKASDGEEIPFSYLSMDIVNPSNVVLQFDAAKLKSNTEYTITSKATDVLGNTPLSVSFKTPSVPAEVSSITDGDMFTDDTSVVYTYKFTVTPNDTEISKITLKSENDTVLDSIDTPVINGGSAVFGIIASHTLKDGENTESIEKPKFNIELN